MRCRFKIKGTTVIATTMYAGTIISATAKCDPSDTFDEEIGKKLAEKRLEYKVAKKRERYYANLVRAKYNQIFELNKELSRISKKHIDAATRLFASEEMLDDYLNEINS